MRGTRALEELLNRRDLLTVAGPLQLRKAQLDFVGECFQLGALHN